MPYLTGSQIESRLSLRFEIETTVLDGDAAIASAELEAQGPFIGSKLDSEQELAFPRSITPSGEANEATTVPAAVLDWVALCAYRIGSDEGPAVTSESARGLSRSFAYPKVSREARRMNYLLDPYLLKAGERL